MKLLVLALLLGVLAGCSPELGPCPTPRQVPIPDPALPTGYTAAGLLSAGFPDSPLILYEIFAAWSSL